MTAQSRNGRGERIWLLRQMEPWGAHHLAPDAKHALLIRRAASVASPHSLPRGHSTYALFFLTVSGCSLLRLRTDPPIFMCGKSSCPYQIKKPKALSLRLFYQMVGARGFEPPTTCTPSKCANPGCATPRRSE